MCLSDDTKDYDFLAVTCASGFSNLYIELADSENSENLLTNETYTASDITISGNETIEFSIQDIAEKKILTLSDSEWEIGTYNYVLTVGDSNNFDITLKLARTDVEGCCSNTLLIESLEIDGEIQEDNSTIFKIPINNLD
ncbi:hypothetical protein [Zobellia laminariae]|uniref:hypothetical protein n=1 Tax=Zobellia laminariae TaxID=248906 RepID=UPI0026F45201|nr:hypothetical protein [Zobellia laminariae]WKX77399.1 hypothetical protein Q5W13_04905 [Zobellia laminariae]